MGINEDELDETLIQRTSVLDSNSESPKSDKEEVVPPKAESHILTMFKKKMMGGAPPPKPQITVESASPRNDSPLPGLFLRKSALIKETKSESDKSMGELSDDEVKSPISFVEKKDSEEEKD